MRILITGNAGAGKSTLGRRIAATVNAPFYSLDKIVWKPGWQKASPQERQLFYDDILPRVDWVIDGVSDTVRNAADVVIFVDLPRRVCFRRAFKRNARYLFRSRPDLPERCPEILIIPTLVKVIWQFPARIRPGIMAHKAASKPHAFVHIRSQEDLDRFIQQTLPTWR